MATADRIAAPGTTRRAGSCRAPGNPRRTWQLAAVGALLTVTVLTGCTGSALFPEKATMPSSREQAYQEIVNKGDDDTEVTESTRLYLSGFDPAVERPASMTAPVQPVPSPLAAELFPMPDLAMPDRPTGAVTCAAIASATGGAKARCASRTDPEMANLPQGTPSDGFVVGRAYPDGRMFLLDRPGHSGEMWDTGMHERGHLLATWLCGQMDCLNAKFEARGHAEKPDYLNSLAEAFAQSWAECQGAQRLTMYRRLPCSDVEAVVTEATKEKKIAKENDQRRKAAYDSAQKMYREKESERDRITRQVEVIERFTERAKSASKAD